MNFAFRKEQILNRKDNHPLRSLWTIIIFGVFFIDTYQICHQSLSCALFIDTYQISSLVICGAMARMGDLGKRNQVKATRCWHVFGMFPSFLFPTRDAFDFDGDVRIKSVWCESLETLRYICNILMQAWLTLWCANNWTAQRVMQIGFGKLNVLLDSWFEDFHVELDFA